MKISLSKTNVSRLALMLADFHKMDQGRAEEDQIWGDFDCLAIIQDLLDAERGRDELGQIDVGEETVLWLSVLLDNMLDAPGEKAAGAFAFEGGKAGLDRLKHPEGVTTP